MVKLVLALILPGSVAVTVTVLTPDIEGVPEMVEGATKFSLRADHSPTASTGWAFRHR